MSERVPFVPAIGLADLVRTADHLGAGPQAVAIAAELLGFRVGGTGDEATPADTTVVGVVESGPSGVEEEETTDEPVVTDEAAEPIAPVPEDAGGLPVTLTTLTAQAAEAPWTTPSLDELLPLGSVAPPPLGLFARRNSRALLSHLCSARVPEGELNVESAVEVLATREPLQALPREWVESTGGRLSVLIDEGPGMAPFEHDAEQLPDELERVVGSDALEPAWFEDCPMGGAIALPERVDRVWYRLPPPGTRILAVTAFGARGYLAPPVILVRRWARFAGAARRAGVPLVVLTPLAARQRPPLPRELPVLTWDRCTDVRTVARAVAVAARGSGRQ